MTDIKMEDSTPIPKWVYLTPLWNCCDYCGKDRGLVYAIGEGRRLCLDCVSVWQKERDNEHKRTD